MPYPTKKEHSWEEKYYKIEPHPYPEHIPKYATILVIGTFPSHEKNADFKFFYGGQSNQFWPLLSVIYGRTFKHVKNTPAIKERIQLLDDFGIGITDMIMSGYRYNEKSGDEYIYPIKVKNIFEILDSNPSIKKLVFTSRTYIIGAFGLFTTLLLQKDLPTVELEPHVSGFRSGTMSYKGNSIKIQVPYSPSQRVLKAEGVDFDYLLKMYKQCFGG